MSVCSQAEPSEIRRSAYLVTWGWILELISSQQRARDLEAQLKQCKLACTSLANEWSAAATDGQKAMLFRQWEQATEERHALQSALVKLERPGGEFTKAMQPKDTPTTR